MNVSDQDVQDQQVIKSIVIVTVAIMVLGIIAFFTAQNIATSSAPKMTTARAEKAVMERIEPVGSVKTADAKPAAGAKVAARSGAEVVTGSCGACHNAGVAGAPKIGSKADWETRAATGMDVMLEAVIKGKGIMPPRGGGDFSDDELKAAIEDMMANSGM